MLVLLQKGFSLQQILIGNEHKENNLMEIINPSGICCIIVAIQDAKKNDEMMFYSSFTFAQNNVPKWFRFIIFKGNVN